MFYFKNDNDVYAYETLESAEKDAERLGLTPLTEQEAAELNKPKEPTLAELKLLKLAELSNWAMKMTDKSAINLKGFGVIDGGYKYLLNVRAMKNNFEALPQKVFRMYDNSFKEINLADLEKIEKAIELGGIMLHTLKWRYEITISKAESKEELEAISFNEVIEIDLDKDNK